MMIKNFFKNKFSIYTFFSLLIKCFIFLSILNSKNAAGFSPHSAFVSLLPFLICTAFVSMIVSFSHLFKNLGQYLYLFIINIIVTTILFFDLCYYRGFTTFISPYLLSQTANLNNLSDSITSLIIPYDLVLWADILIILFIIILLKIKRTKFNFKVKRHIAGFLILFIIPFIYIYMLHLWMDVFKLDKKYRTLFNVKWKPIYTMNNLSPIGYHIFDMYNFCSNSMPHSLSSNDKKGITSWYKKNNENLPDNKYKGMFKGNNLLIIQHESLENFVINRKINNQEITPNLNKLLGNSLYFNHYHEQVNEGVTSDAEFMTNTSIYPLRNGSVFFTYPKNTYYNSLPNLMKGLGYSTTAIHPDNGSYWNWMAAQKSIGFEKCIDASYFKQDETIGLGLSDASFLRQAEPIIKNERRPFYNFMITLTSHSPFNLPKKYRELNLPNYLDSSYLGGYFQSVHYTDEAIGNFLNQLNKDGVLDNTLVVIYGDHTGIHKYFQNEVNNLKPSESWWLDDHMEVPLIIWHKNMKPQEISINGGQVDLLPTLAYLMGIEPSKIADTAMGRNLLNTKKDFSVLTDRSYIGQDYSNEKSEVDGLDIADKIIRSNYFKK